MFHRESWQWHAYGLTYVIKPIAILFFLSLTVGMDVLVLPWALAIPSHKVHHIMHGVRTTILVPKHPVPFIEQQEGAFLFLVILIAATVAHELGHASALRRRGATDLRITFHGLGGVCSANAKDTSPRATAFYAGMGPAATALVIVVLFAVYAIHPIPRTVRVVCWLSAVMQAANILANVIPVHPRNDGAFVLRAVLTLLYGKDVGDTSFRTIWRPFSIAWFALLSALLLLYTVHVSEIYGAAGLAIAVIYAAMALTALIRYRRSESAAALLPHARVTFF